MTVRELVAQLKACDPDAVVTLANDHHYESGDYIVTDVVNWTNSGKTDYPHTVEIGTDYETKITWQSVKPVNIPQLFKNEQHSYQKKSGGHFV